MATAAIPQIQHSLPSNPPLDPILGPSALKGLVMNIAPTKPGDVCTGLPIAKRVALSCKGGAHYAACCLSEGAGTAAIKPAAVTSRLPVRDETEILRQKEVLVADLQVLTHEFERFKQSVSPQDAADTQQLMARVDFFLSYVARVIADVREADDAKLTELEMQIKTYLHPLKEKIIAQCQPPRAPAAVPPLHEVVAPVTFVEIKDEDPQAPPVLPTLCKREQSFGDATSAMTTTASESSEDGLDDFDFECFERMMDAHDEPSRPAEETPSDLLRHESFVSDMGDVTDTASLTSCDEAPFSPMPTVSTSRGVKRTSEEAIVEIKEEVPPARVARLLDSAPTVAEEIIIPTIKKPTFSGFTRTQPRDVEYQCVSCSETYSSSCLLNPWWALNTQSCPKCHKQQVPRIDITAGANAMDYHPALLAEEGDDDSDDEGSSGAGAASLAMELEALTGGLDGGETEDVFDEDECSLTPEQASQLLVMLAHARTCPGHHTSRAHAQVCLATKFLILHVRDCDGKTLDGEPCGFTWCKPCKLLMGHLVRCAEPDRCAICFPEPGALSPSVAQLRNLNMQRELQLGQGQSVATSTSRNPPMPVVKPCVDDLLCSPPAPTAYGVDDPLARVHPFTCA